VRLVSSWMTVISSCSQSNHRFRQKFQLLLAIVHTLCGSMHVVRRSVVLILVLPKRSSQSNDSAGIRHTLFLGVMLCLDPKTNLCRFLNALLVPAETEGHQRPAIWKALSTTSAVSPVLNHSCWTRFLDEVDWCSIGCTASWCHRLCSIPNLAFQAHLRASHHRVPFSCFE